MKMKDIEHTNPHTNEAFGGMFDHGSPVVADGGRNEDEDCMEDVNHESPNEGATRSFERGTEGRSETV